MHVLKILIFQQMNKEHKVPFGLMGLFLAVGIVYGDIGTSPLYVMKAILSGLPAGQKAKPEFIYGAISCIIWTLTLQTTVKYVLITLRADNHGEGGIVAAAVLGVQHQSKVEQLRLKR